MHGYVKRKALKKTAGGHVNRNAQFERIAGLKATFNANGYPVMSVDTKKKELIGNLFREGKIYTSEAVEVFDHDFPTLAEGVAIRHAIYPPFTSKWHPVEHRLFPHVTRSLQGMVLTTHNLANELIEGATTTSGLKVYSTIVNRIYETGRKVAKGFKESMRIKFDDFLPTWNYVAQPE